MPNIKIKTATIADAPLIEALAKEIWTQHYASIITMAQITYMLDRFQSADAISKDIQNGAFFDIAYLEDEPCGYSATFPKESGFFLSKLYVKQSCRAQGVARTLVSHVDARAKDVGAPRIWLTCNKHNKNSLAAYERLGFSIIEECETDIGNGFIMDDYVLEKQ